MFIILLSSSFLSIVFPDTATVGEVKSIWTGLLSVSLTVDKFDSFCSSLIYNVFPDTATVDEAKSIWTGLLYVSENVDKIISVYSLLLSNVILDIAMVDKAKSIWRIYYLLQKLWTNLSQFVLYFNQIFWIYQRLMRLKQSEEGLYLFQQLWTNLTHICPCWYIISF